MVIIERGNTLLNRNVAHVKRFLEPDPAVSSHMPFEPLPSHPVIRSRQQFDLAQPSTETLPESELNSQQHHFVVPPQPSMVLSPPSVVRSPEVLPQ